MKNVCIVTGGSSGIGLETTKVLRDAGYTVYELSRRGKGAEGVFHISCDVTEEDEVKRAVNTVLSSEGRIDLLVNCAGYGISGAVEFTPIEDAKRQLDVNFFGMVNVNKAVIPVMRKQGKGRIINVSSVAGPIPIPFQAYYSVSKAAINSYTMATANEIRPFGVSMCAVQPGDMATGFTSARKKIGEGDDAYGGRIERSVSGMEKDERGGKGPETAARFILRIAGKKRVKPLYTIGFVYKLFCFLAKVLPAGLLNRIVGMIYAK